MGRSPCCDKVGLKKGPWTPEEDQKLLAYIEEQGHGSWRALPGKAGLQRCGKSCRLRWTNYLRPDIKRGKFSLQEEQTIIQLHALLGNRWSAIATHLPKRTDNEIKNYWNTHLKKRLAKMGIDPVTHKPKSDALGSVDGQTKTAANLSHMAQWESARLEAEARLVRESKLRSTSINTQSQLGTAGSSDSASAPLKPAPPLFLDVFKAWQSVWSKPNNGARGGISETGIGGPQDLESPTSTLSFSENPTAAIPSVGFGENTTATIDFIDSSVLCKEEEEVVVEEWKGYGNGGGSSSSSSSSDEKASELELDAAAAGGGLHLHDMVVFPTTKASWSAPESPNRPPAAAFIEGFTDLLLHNSDDKNSNDGDENEDEADDDNDDAKNYWNNILNLVNSSPSDSPLF